MGGTWEEQTNKEIDGAGGYIWPESARKWDGKVIAEIEASSCLSCSAGVTSECGKMLTVAAYFRG